MRLFCAKKILAAAVFALLGALQHPVSAKEKLVELAKSVEAGKTQTARMANLARDVHLQFNGTVSAPLIFHVLDRPLRAGEKSSAKNAVFSSRADAVVSFSMNVPRDGDYYLVLDNSEGAKSVDVKLRIHASLEQGDDVGSSAAIDQKLNGVVASLAQVFIFEHLAARPVNCDQANAFSSGNAILICIEYADALMRVLKDKTKAGNALLFILFHEFGHAMLKQWGIPLYDNEDAVDEFATTLMVMFKKHDAARDQAEYFSALPTEPEVRRKLEKYDRHALSVQRGRNILTWLADDKLLKKWQPLLVPHMQTEFLRRLVDKPLEWTDVALLKRELARRG